MYDFKGPIGIKLGNDVRGYPTVLSASGQAEAKGAVAGDIIVSIGGIEVLLYVRDFLLRTRTPDSHFSRSHFLSKQ